MSEGNAFAGINFGNQSDLLKQRSLEMCPKWKQTSEIYLDNKCKLQIIPESSKSVMIKGIIAGNFLKARYIKYWAAASATLGLGFDGSGLPYPNEEVAFSGSSNQGVLETFGDFIFKIKFPNSYYTSMGKILVPPSIMIRFMDENKKDISPVYKIPIGSSIPYRSLTWNQQRDWNKGPLWYQNPNVPFISQSKIITENKYPTNNQEYPHFWGTRPPV